MTRKMKISDYNPQWSWMSYHCRKAVLYDRNRVLRNGNSPERSAKNSRQLGFPVPFGNLSRISQVGLQSWLCRYMFCCIGSMSGHILLYRINVGTDSAVSDQNRNNVPSCRTVSCGTRMIRRNRIRSGIQNLANIQIRVLTIPVNDDWVQI